MKTLARQDYKSSPERSDARTSGVLAKAFDPISAAFNCASVGLGCLSAELKFLRWNPALLELSGWTAEAIGQQKLDEVFPCARALVENANSTAICVRKPEERLNDATLVRRDNSIVVLDFVLQLIDQNDLTKGFALTVIDTTQQAYARQRMIRARDESRILSRSRNDEEQARDFFLAVLEHELRAPLTPLLTWTGVLKQEPTLTAQMRRAITVIERNVLQQKAMVDDILDLASSHAGKLILDRQRIKIHDVIGDVVRQYTPKAIEKGITLTFESAAPNAVVLADSRRLAQIVANLIDNAVKFTPAQGAVNVKLDCANDCVRIEVADTGIGIPPEFMSEIFCCFTQAHDMTSKHRRGLGLGLALVKDLVEKHNGTVEAQSEGERKGSRFIIKLPLLSNEQDSNSNPALLLRDRAKKILIIEDGDDTREALMLLLESWGLQVAHAADGLQGLEALTKFQPNLILCDLSMPVMDGWTFAQHVRDNWPLAQIPMIALTGHGTSEDVKRSRDAGFRDHLLKPFEPNTLLQLLALHLPPVNSQHV